LQALHLFDLLGEDLDIFLEVEAVADALSDPDFGEVGLGLGLGAASELDLRGRSRSCGGLGFGRLVFLSIQGEAERS